MLETWYGPYTHISQWAGSKLNQLAYALHRSNAVDRLFYRVEESIGSRLVVVMDVDISVDYVQPSPGQDKRQI